MSPKLPVINPKRLVKVLMRTGFEIDHQRGSHVVMRHLIDGRRAVVPMHGRDIPKGTLKGILKDIGLDVDDFVSILKNI